MEGWKERWTVDCRQYKAVAVKVKEGENDDIRMQKGQNRQLGSPNAGLFAVNNCGKWAVQKSGGLGFNRCADRMTFQLTRYNLRLTIERTERQMVGRRKRCGQ